MANGAVVNRQVGRSRGGGGSSLLVGHEPPVAAQVSQRGGPLPGGLVQAGQGEMGVSEARGQRERPAGGDRESTRLKSSHQLISYSGFFFEKKKKISISHLHLRLLTAF